MHLSRTLAAQYTRAITSPPRAGFGISAMRGAHELGE
jgi:hypothetical protein